MGVVIIRNSAFAGTQHWWPTTPNIVGCYKLRPFAHSVAQSLTCKRTQQLPSSNESKIYLHVANVLVGGGGGEEALGASSVGLILCADTRVRIFKKTRRSNAPQLAVLTQGKL